ncbi:MAG: hypothetical protein A3B68_00255 [Candidatus Melainabacteria bacterium RIFCSPHIGHO2_02_FULL_34_12]|nr:MAG: hypothetical protein A3B68_00255 [Candidatus Melainabacteria bacterium RIFCSPHIGHO2_02_FULL_34_12]
METFKNLANKYLGLSTVLKSFFLLLILFLIFFGVNLFITIKDKPKSAYSILNEEGSKMMLQDTRVHNWSELEKGKK